MTASKYEAMARTNESKTNQWKRLDLDAELTGLVQGLSVLSGAPAVITPPVPPNLQRHNSPLLTVDGTADKIKENVKSEVVELSKEVAEEH
jgi:hypothetical protein